MYLHFTDKIRNRREKKIARNDAYYESKVDRLYLKCATNPGILQTFQPQPSDLVASIPNHRHTTEPWNTGAFYL